MAWLTGVFPRAYSVPDRAWRWTESSSAVGRHTHGAGETLTRRRLRWCGWSPRGRSSSAFQMTTLAAMLNDFGGWTLIAWQPAFYERVHHLPVEVCLN